MTLVMASGGFDPLHIGHVRYLEAARCLGDRLVVVVNGDSFLTRKKGKPFMLAEERVEIVRALRCVDAVFRHESESDTVADAILVLRPDIFAKGGDRSPDQCPLPHDELDACRQVNCRIAYGVGGGKVQSSSSLLISHAMGSDA